ncbi:DNA topoisomerase IV subunit A [Eggerthia catenaformis]|uniref:DNA topoisomerase IV subunit A n=1 Tax=Eggerthia catenaformis TaxID=31973 RepID=UPI0028EA0152|nr:DNA topoisomerase IV subunit A [Eggerthia catenaformis]
MEENKDKILIMSLDDIMGDRFGRYSKYIIQDRALPDVRDGLKPVQRRILYAMYKEGNLPGKPYRKSAKTVGNVIGNYHPHGDSSVYEAMVRLSQEWKMRMPLIDMQGNNGSIDNDPAAAMRYTEARLAPISLELLKDIDKETVLETLNFDDTEYEPTVLPAKFPHLLVNGATGISAGYATDIPPHNLKEVIDAAIHRIKHPHCSFEELTGFIKGPDFPTGAIAEGKKDILNALKTGKGKVTVRSKTEIIQEKSLNKIVISEIPYEVNKAELVRKIDEIRFNKDIDGIIEVRDESDRSGLRIVIDLKKDVDTVNTLNYFFKNTELQKNYNYNMVAIKDKRPELMGIEKILDGYIDHAIEVVTKRSQFDLNKARNREHIVEGLIHAVSILDEVVYTIRHSHDKADAKINLQNKYQFSEKQSEAIVMLQLYRLTNTDIVALQEELKSLQETIETLVNILNNEKVLRSVIINELKELKKAFPSPRLTEIKDSITDTSINEQAMIIAEDCYVTVTRDGYIKKVSERSYKASEDNTFGKKDDDYMVSLHKAVTLNTLLVFTDAGNYCFIPVYKLEEFKWKELGKHISYLVKMGNDEKVISTVLIKDFNVPYYIIIATKDGQIKRVLLKDFEVSRYSKAYKCINLKKEDRVVDIAYTKGHNGLVLGTKAGYATLFSEEEVSVMGLKASGVKAMNIKNDELAYMCCFDPSVDESLLLFTKPAGIKRIHVGDIPAAKRGARGIIVCKKPKTKEQIVIKGIVAHTKDQLTLYSNQEPLNLYARDYSFTGTANRVSTIKGLNSEIDYIYYANEQIIGSDDKENDKENKEPVIDMNVEDHNLFDELNYSNDNKETRQPYQEETHHKIKKIKEFKTITLEDLLDDDEF